MDNQKKRILIFSTTYYPFIGGAEIAVREITNRITDIEFDLITVNLDGSQTEQETVDRTNVYRIGSGRLGKLFFPIRACLLASRLNRKHKYDAFWSIMASYAGFASLLFSYRHPKIPFILTLQEGDSKKELKAKFQFVWFLFKKIFERAHIVQAISKYLANFSQSVNTDTPVVVIPNGVDVYKFTEDVSAQAESLKKDLNKGSEDVFLVTTSRLVKKNAVRDVIVSLERLPKNVKFLVVGDGPLRLELEKGAKKSGVLERVIFVGEIAHNNILPYLKASDIFVRPSLSEGFGNSFVEAMAAGLPVIATPVGGIVDFIENGQTGLLCKVNNPESIAEQVTKLLESPDLGHDLVSNASSLVREKYDWEIIANRMKNEVFGVVLK